MQVPHFFVDPADVEGREARLRGSEAVHLCRVLRARADGVVSLADGHGAVYDARVRQPGEEVRLAIVGCREVPPSRPALSVVHALPQGRKLDDVVQRLTELGVARLVPVHSDRSQVRLEGDKAERALRRWGAVALAAAKQSRRARLLEIAPVGRWEAAFRDVAPGAVLWEGATARLRHVLEDPAGADALTLAVGPEGGLEPAEVEACGLAPATLGPTILRTETAALVGATAVLTLAGRLG